MINAVTLGVNWGLSAALTTAYQVLNSLLFDVYYIPWRITIRVNQNSAIRGSTWTERTSVQSRMHSCCTHLLKESKFLVNGWSRDGWHTCYKSIMLIPTEWAKWLNACSSWYAKVNILTYFSPFCWTERITSCISILKNNEKSRLKAAFWPHRNHDQIYFQSF